MPIICIDMKMASSVPNTKIDKKNWVSLVTSQIKHPPLQFESEVRCNQDIDLPTYSSRLPFCSVKWQKSINEKTVCY